jgi:hypothetical protein
MGLLVKSCTATACFLCDFQALQAFSRLKKLNLNTMFVEYGISLSGYQFFTQNKYHTNSYYTFYIKLYHKQFNDLERFRFWSSPIRFGVNSRPTRDKCELKKITQKVVVFL